MVPSLGNISPSKCYLFVISILKLKDIDRFLPDTLIKKELSNRIGPEHFGLWLWPKIFQMYCVYRKLQYYQFQQNLKK